MITSRLRLLALWTLVGVACPACVIPDIDLSCRRFPCAEGSRCDIERDECVPIDAGDASLPDGGRDAGRDGGIDAGPPPPYCDTLPDAIFCEDFEGGDLSRWDTIPEGGMPFISPSSARTGAKGLRITSSDAVAPRIVATIDAPDETDLWFSAWVLVHEGSTGTFDVFELFASDAGSITGQMVPEPEAFLVRVAATGTPGVSSQVDRRWTLGMWTCVRARVVRRLNGSAEVSARGPGAVLDPVDTNLGAPFDAFSIALAPGSDVDIDDVVWSTTETSCPLR